MERLSDGTPFMTLMPKDPTVMLDFADPTTAPPFGARTFWLKQCDFTSLDPAIAHALAFFSSYRGMWEENKIRDVAEAETMLASLLPSGGSTHEVRTDLLPNRRFSGDGFLSPARYFTLCRANGVDGGTMRREITAYHDPLMTGSLYISDTTESDVMNNGLGSDESQHGVYRSQPSLLVSIPPFTAIQHEWLGSGTRRWETAELVLPMRITQQSFERVVDLRMPEVATWFTHNLSRLRWVTGDGSYQRAFPRKAALDEFAELLPSLMVQRLGGGNGATRIAGQWLRAIGADALVFPSARSDSALEIHEGDVRSFYGWNLVDYRGALPPRLQTIDLTRNWISRVADEVDQRPLPIHARMALLQESDGSAKHSWSWMNVEESNAATHLLATAHHLYKWARGGISDDQRKQLYVWLGATVNAEALSHRCGLFIRALLGDPKLRCKLIESESGEMHLLNTFDRMDSKLTAGWAGRLG